MPVSCPFFFRKLKKKITFFQGLYTSLSNRRETRRFRFTIRKFYFNFSRTSQISHTTCLLIANRRKVNFIRVIRSFFLKTTRATIQIFSILLSRFFQICHLYVYRTDTRRAVSCKYAGAHTCNFIRLIKMKLFPKLDTLVCGHFRRKLVYVFFNLKYYAI